MEGGRPAVATSSIFHRTHTGPQVNSGRHTLKRLTLLGCAPDCRQARQDERAAGGGSQDKAAQHLVSSSLFSGLSIRARTPKRASLVIIRFRQQGRRESHYNEHKTHTTRHTTTRNTIGHNHRHKCGWCPTASWGSAFSISSFLQKTTGSARTKCIPVSQRAKKAV